MYLVTICPVRFPYDSVLLVQLKLVKPKSAITTANLNEGKYLKPTMAQREGRWLKIIEMKKGVVCKLHAVVCAQKLPILSEAIIVFQCCT